jgi:hypothetical protein
MKCNHCDNEAVYSEDFAILEHYMTDEQTAQQQQIEKKRIKNTLLFGAVGGFLISSSDVAPTEKFIGFVREYICDKCYDKYRTEIELYRERAKKSKVVAFISLAVLILMIIVLVLTHEVLSTQVWAVLFGFGIGIPGFSFVGCIAFNSGAKRAMELAANKLTKKRACPNIVTYKEDLYVAGKAPLLNMVNISVQPSESFDDMCKEIFNSPHLNDPLREEGNGNNKSIPANYIIHSMKDGASEFARNVYDKMLIYLTPEKEEARVELLHSRLQ